MDRLKLISTPTCPYVQRAAIALREKGQAFEVEYVDLQNKPDWFLAVSPLGKVPVLQVRRDGAPDASVFESMVILEYLEDVSEGRKLHPADPLERARHRGWMEFGNGLLGDLGKAVGAGDEAELAKASAVLSAKAARLDEAVTGPLFAGEAFCNVDAVYASLFRQMDLIEKLRGEPLFDCPPKVLAWRKALAARDSVKAAVPADYEERYVSRLKARGATILRQAA